MPSSLFHLFHPWRKFFVITVDSKWVSFRFWERGWGERLTFVFCLNLSSEWKIYQRSSYTVFSEMVPAGKGSCGYHHYIVLHSLPDCVTYPVLFLLLKGLCLFLHWSFAVLFGCAVDVMFFLLGIPVAPHLNPLTWLLRLLWFPFYDFMIEKSLFGHWVTKSTFDYLSAFS